MRLIKDFRDYLRVDRQLRERTVYRHIYEVKRFFKSVTFNPLQAEKANLRSYLKRFNGKSPNTYANVLKSLRVFYRDYLGRKEVVEGFKFPYRPVGMVVVPSQEDLKRFYKALDNIRDRALFLIYATTGLRCSEVVQLTLKDVDLEKRMIIPKGSSSRTKKTYITFYNEEASCALKQWLEKKNDNDPRVFPMLRRQVAKIFRQTSDRVGIKISAQMLRDWFCNEMGLLGVSDRYIDAFCGRVPKTVLARHYTDFSPDKLKRIYDKAQLKVLS